MGKFEITDAMVRRFEKFVMPEPNSGCWLWMGDVSRHGHGNFSVNGKGVRAHRFSYLKNKGEIPDGLSVCHHCDVPCCVNPDHLYAGTQSQNLHDALRRNRIPRALRVDDVMNIRASSLSGPKLAAQYNVSRQTIHRIRTRKSRPHL